MALRKKLLAEFLGTTLLLACVVGSGIMGVNLSQGNDAIALLANAGATAGVLYVLIVVLGPISGAHFNPAVTMVMRSCFCFISFSFWIVTLAMSLTQLLSFLWNGSQSGVRNPAAIPRMFESCGCRVLFRKRSRRQMQ